MLAMPPRPHESMTPIPMNSWVWLAGMLDGLGSPQPALSCALGPGPDMLMAESFRGAGEARHH